MNLRKLLCGLLALCLLLTMAPAALMEELEAPVAEVVEELGEVAEAEDLTTIGHDDTEDDIPAVVKDAEVVMHVGDTKTLTYEYEIKRFAADTDDVVSMTKTGKKLTLKAKKPGDTIVTVTLSIDDDTTITAIANVTVKGNEDPNNVHLYDADGEDITRTTQTLDLGEGVDKIAYAIVYAEDMTALKISDDYSKIIWSSSNAKVAKIVSTGAADEKRTGVQISPKAVGTAKITATVKDTNVKGSFTVKVADTHKPTKIKIIPNRKNNVFQTLTDKQNIYPIGEDPLQLRANVDPADYEYNVTWTVSDTKLAWFLNSKEKKVSSITKKNGNTDEWVDLHINTKKTGTITITAKLNNGTKTTMKVRLIDLTKASKVGITLDNEDETSIDGKKITAQLTGTTTVYGDYGEDSKITYQGKEFAVKGHIQNYLGKEIKPKKGQISWTSSNPKIATVRKDNRDARYGVITPKKVGKTTITMKVTSETGKAKTSSFTLNVTDPAAPKAIYFVDDNNVEISSLTLKKGQKVSLNIEAEYVTGKDPMISYSQLKFKSSRNSKVTVSPSGIITAVAKGQSYITVKTYNNLTKKLKVIVK